MTNENTEHNPEQAWFRTPAWQTGETEADHDIAEGRVTRHDSVDALFASLDA